jgi:copper chaperone for superoxide dismutase
LLTADGENKTGAAVAILETHARDAGSHVCGLARIVQVSPKLTIVDLTVQGLSPGVYHASVRTAGDISYGAASTGGLWGADDGDAGQPRGDFGTIDVGESGAASLLLDKSVEVWEMIGRGFVVSRKRDGGFTQDELDTVVGVIARSAGIWENEKTVGLRHFLLR